MTDAIVVGAGPGGLATAIALRTAGLGVRVFERAPEAAERGSGLTLWPNALAALGHLGAEQAVRAVARPVAGIALRSWRGALLSATPGDLMVRRWHGPGVTLHRADLLRALQRVLGPGVVEHGARCIGFDVGARGVRVRLADGREVHGDLLVGADGLRSVVCAQAFAPPALRYAGYPVWRGLASLDLPDGPGVMTMGAGAQFGFFPMTGGRTYWFASVNAPEGSDRRGPHARRLLARFGDWHDPIPRLLDATAEGAILVTDVYDRRPLRRWTHGRAALVGDAAHPAAPTLGQGACQAIEDAVTLGHCLAGAADVARALRTYERRRARRAGAMTSQARWMGRLGQWRRPLACWLRERVIRATPEGVRLRHLDWMFRFEP